jgi:hypothetical protein
MFSKRFLLEKGVKREDLDEQYVTVESPGSVLQNFSTVYKS